MRALYENASKFLAIRMEAQNFYVSGRTGSIFQKYLRKSGKSTLKNLR